MQIGIGAHEDTRSSEQQNIGSASDESKKNLETQKKSHYVWLRDDILDGKTTIVLLRRELESALVSLDGVQAHMVKLVSEKEEMTQLEMQSKKNIEHLTVEVLRLESEINDKERQFKLRLLELEEKLQAIEGSTVTSNVCWRKMKEVQLQCYFFVLMGINSTNGHNF